MTDTLERDLAARLHDLGAAVPDTLEPPADLELRVARRHRRKPRLVGLSGLAAAASVLVAVSIVAVVHGAPERRRVGVSPAAAAVARLDGTVMLDARGPWVIALDAHGHQAETLVTAHRGAVVDAQLTRDHRTLWYLSVAGTTGLDCGEVVRADIGSGASKIVTRAIAFGISPDGSRLAVSGGDECPPALGTQLVVRDVNTGAQSTTESPAIPTGLSWSADGKQLATETCVKAACGQVAVYDVPARLGGRLSPNRFDTTGHAAFGPDGLYLSVGPTLVRLEPGTNVPTNVVLVASRAIVRVVPTARGTYVVTRSRPNGPPDQLGRVEGGRLVPVRTFADGFGTITPVWQPR